MLINRDYIQARLKELVRDKQESNQTAKSKSDRLYRIKMSFPKWLRNIVFHPFNPVYSVYLQSKTSKGNQRGHLVKTQSLQPFAITLIDYFLKHDTHFETNDYYPQSDDASIKLFLDSQLKSLIPGYDQIVYNQAQREIFKEKSLLAARSKKTTDGYLLPMRSNVYFLPQNTFEYYVFGINYGLVVLPEYIKEYIAGKDFFDIGAFIGDTAIMLSNVYNPSHVYSYEPVSENVSKLARTIERNNLRDKITLMQKGIADQEMEIDMHVQSSASSINQSTTNANAKKERVKITTIDKECCDRKVGLIKMDIEGAELAAIKGGLETIKRNKPVLLISLYHTAADFFEIPALLKEAVPDYLFRFIDIEVVNPYLEKILIAYPPED